MKQKRFPPIALDPQAMIAVYFRALDEGHIEEVMELFNDNASLSCPSDGTVCKGSTEIRAFFDRITEESDDMSHVILNVVTDENNQKCAVELTYRDQLRTGELWDMDNCNFFEFDEDGRFQRVRFWMGANRAESGAPPD